VLDLPMHDFKGLHFVTKNCNFHKNKPQSWDISLIWKRHGANFHEMASDRGTLHLATI
jgi:hypothetical protein